MQIVCPTCDARYEIEEIEEEALLVCHRCETEFTVAPTPPSASARVLDDAHLLSLLKSGRSSDREGAKEERPLRAPTVPFVEPVESGPQQDAAHEPELPTAEPDAPLRVVPERFDVHHYVANHKSVSDKTVVAEEQASQQQAAHHSVAAPRIVPLHEEPESEPLDESEEVQTHTAAPRRLTESMIAPHRKRASIWPWLTALLLLIGAAGFWFKQDIWLDNLWLRTILIRMHMPVDVRPTDWRIESASVQAQWVTRDDQSQVLMIQGQVSNLLAVELPLPMVRIRFYAAENPTQLVGEFNAEITDLPNEDLVRHAPYIKPATDQFPVAAKGSRTFVLVVENAPEKIGDFALDPLPQKAH